MTTKLYNFKHDFPFKDKYFDKVVEGGFDVKLVRHKNTKAKKKILFVLDHVPTEDLASGKLLSGWTGEIFFRLTDLAFDFYQADYELEEYDYLVVNYNCFKTYGMSEDWQLEADLEFSRRLRSIITEYKPDVVHTFGRDPHVALSKEQIISAENNFQNLYGQAVSTSCEFEKRKHKFKHVASMGINQVCPPRGDNNNTPNLLGYLARNLVTTLDGGRNRHNIPFISDEKKRSFTIRLCDTIGKVKKCLARMAKAKYVAIDTETENLHRKTNRIQTVQFCDDGKTAYIIPIYHKDTPFSPKELRKISTMMRDYFEVDNQNVFQIYANAQFDLNVMRNAFDIRYYCSNVWDVQAGEFGLDENMKFMGMVTGKFYYGLGNLAMQYGCWSYYTIPFGKEKRATISQVDLDKDVQDYCALDVVIPWHIMRSQWARAKEINYKKYKSLVGEQISDQIHTFSILESTGAYTDVDYLFKLQHPNSPINIKIAEIEAEIYTSEEVEQVNELIAEVKDTPKHTGLLGQKVKINNFSMNKEEHLQMLMFDVMDLEPISTSSKKKRSNGKDYGKIDKNFQKAHKENKLVSLFSEWKQACKLRNAYVKNLIKLWGTNADFKHDQRIRPSYSYQKVVTGRTSASDPNLQQIPSRSKLGKLIKRLFVARPGKILIKVDYSAHEVRGWSIISGDKGVADLFEQGAKLRKRFRILPDPWIAERIELEGDVHKINASYFFGVPITMKEKIAEIRQSVKQVIFGLIYQQGDNGLAESTGQTVEKIVELKGKFLDRFPVGLKWFDKIKNFARKNLFVESPVGRRRHLWGLMLPEDYPNRGYAISSQERRAVNSPVQGFGSDIMMVGIRAINELMFKHYQKTGHYPGMDLCVSVHDSVTVECDYEDFWLALDLIEKGLTTVPVKKIIDRVDYDFTSMPEIDFEIGGSEKEVKGWDFSYAHMEKLVRDTLEFQRDELGHDVDVEKAFDIIMHQQYDTMPDWMKKQVHTADIKMESLGKDIRSENERRKFAKWVKELPKNVRKMEKLKEKEEGKVSVEKRKKIKTVLAERRRKRRLLKKYQELQDS
jgi:DNA polymerase I-like protein with 3'-5' exonuclease and polymerase domains